MAALTAKLFRDFFGGSWSGRIIKNGEFQREVIFNWPQLNGEYSSLGTETGLMTPTGSGVLDDTRQVFIAGWRSDCHIWCYSWHNEFGGYGELKWTSQEKISGITVLFGMVHECKQEGDDPTDHIAMCEIYDQANFKYTIRSDRKGILEIDFKRVRTAGELTSIMKEQVKSFKSFRIIADKIN
jgi:hypothetical protein